MTIFLVFMFKTWSRPKLYSLYVKGWGVCMNTDAIQCNTDSLLFNVVCMWGEQEIVGIHNLNKLKYIKSSCQAK